MRRLALFAPLLAVVLLTGCATVGYYAQAVGGHFDLLGRARPIDELLAAQDTDAQLRERLGYARDAREYASRELLLPDNGAYRHYADLGRPYAVWNVFATPELSLVPKQWCFPVAGCVAYRGYFAREQAENYAAELRAEGYDAFVGGAAAYSTLGWFDDPLTSTMLARPLPELAGLIFHELAHQKLYVRDDTLFNESFAVAVEIEGVRRWLAANGNADEHQQYLARRERREAFIQLLLDTRERLEAVYVASLTDAEKRARKRELLEALTREHDALKARFGGKGGVDDWLKQGINNAHLASVGLYHRHVGAFQALLRSRGGDLAAFYSEVEKLAALPATARGAYLSAAALPP